MSTLQNRLHQLRALTAEARSLGVDVGPEEQERAHIDVAVVGEIKRGKSTFLNALMRSKVFPSRAQVCTSAVTVLVDAPVPAITIRYRDPTKRPNEHPDVPEGTSVFDVMMATVAKPVKRKDGVQGNPDAAEVDEVEIGFPNRFAVEGIRLVDTPGVNDPDIWREDVTYRYLSRADAAIMLLDPQQPISDSEVSFLRDKVQARVKQQLLFVVNKADEVSPKDLEASLERIRRELKPWVNDPQIYPLAAKPALDAALSGAATDERFTAFEHALDRFLRHGRAGGLLTNRLDLLLEGVGRSDAALCGRLAALDQEQGMANAELDRMEQLLQEKRRSLLALEQSMRSWLDGNAHKTAATLREELTRVRGRIGRNPHGAKAALDQARRDLATALEQAGFDLSKGLTDQFGDSARHEASAIAQAWVRGPSINLAAFNHHAPTATGTDDSARLAKGGAAVGMMFGGPLGALVGGILGAVVGSSMNDQQKQLDEQRFVAAAHAYLAELERTARSQVEELTRSVASQTIPALCYPLRTAILDETRRVEASRHDIAQSANDRAATRSTLLAKQSRLHAFRARCLDVQRALAAG
jgi:GTP-binding protein EngB required for normal cell division